MADTGSAVSGVSAIALAKAKVTGASKTNQQLTRRASLVVGKGDARATCDFDAI